MISVTKLFEFEASHHLPFHEGHCKNLHGHSYKLEVEVGMSDADFIKMKNNMLIDFSELKSIVSEHVLTNLDHSNLNDLFIEPPTAEYMVMIFVLSLRGRFDEKIKLQRVRLWETSTSYAEWRV